MNLNWVQLAIPLIALGVWILASIIGNAQQKARVPRRNLPKPPQAAPVFPVAMEGEALRPTEEHERKLEEAKKRRKAAGERQQEVDRKRQAESDQARRRATPGQEPARPVVVAPEPPRRTERSPEPVPMAQPVARDSAPRERPVARPMDMARLSQPAPARVSTLLQVQGPAARVKRDAPSPVATEIARLLQNPTSLAAAFILREVFDPPLAMRKRKR